MARDNDQFPKWTRSGVIFVVLVAICAAGCQDNRMRLGPIEGPGIVAPTPLSGRLSVMLPYDVRPSVEHQGSAPGLESYIYLLFVIIDKERGSYVTSDDMFRVPYGDKQGPSRFGTAPSVPAAVGEDIFNCIQNAHLFESMNRLCPPGRRNTWDLAAMPTEPPRIFSGPAEMLALNSSEQESQNLDLRAQAAPLPAFTSEWLLRARILHLYGCHFSETSTVTIILPGPNNSTSTYTQQTTKGYEPSGNAVLAFELYHNTRNGPVLMWERIVSGSLSEASGSNGGLVVQALSVALDKMIRSLVDDLPQIRARSHAAQVEAVNGAPSIGS